MKNILSSKMLLASIAFSFATYFSPAIERAISSGEFTKKDYQDAATGILIVITQACMRYAATDTVYTNKGLPGRDKPDTNITEDSEIFY